MMSWVLPTVNSRSAGLPEPSVKYRLCFIYHTVESGAVLLAFAGYLGWEVLKTYLFQQCALRIAMQSPPAFDKGVFDI